MRKASTSSCDFAVKSFTAAAIFAIFSLIMFALYFVVSFLSHFADFVQHLFVEYRYVTSSYTDYSFVDEC